MKYAGDMPGALANPLIPADKMSCQGQPAGRAKRQRNLRLWVLAPGSTMRARRRPRAAARGWCAAASGAEVRGTGSHGGHVTQEGTNAAACCWVSWGNEHCTLKPQNTIKP